MHFSSNVIDTGTPPIPIAKAWANQYGGASGPLIDLSQAAPGDAPSTAFQKRISLSAECSNTATYGSLYGDLSLREAYAKNVSDVYAAKINPDEVAITAGCNQAFFATALLIAKPGDAIILPYPWYFNHQMSLTMLGIEPRGLTCHPEYGFTPRIEDAEKLIDENVRAIVLVTPNNPTGAIYPPDLIEDFYNLCVANNIWLILDETYRDFLPSQSIEPHKLFNQTEWQKNIIQLYSFSKSYSIPGHRLGAMTTSTEALIEAAKILDSIQICPPRTIQPALAWAIDALAQWREEKRQEINQRANAFKSVMTEVDGWKVESVGAYFAFLKHPFEGMPAEKVGERLATEHGILCLPGPYFGPDQQNHLRIAFANVGIPEIEAIPERLMAMAMD